MVAEVTLGIYFWRIGEIKKLRPSPREPKQGKTLAFIFKHQRSLNIFLCCWIAIDFVQVLFTDVNSKYSESIFKPWLPVAVLVRPC